MELKEILKQRRKVLALSQKNLAEMAGISLATIKEIERGKGNPSLSTISKVVDILGMEIRYVVKHSAL